jgi:ABC-type transport system involved in cytochrome bd biosynthesis fused ATPase/permease subunit
VVIDKGGIAEMGSHDELLARNGVYKRLVLRQLTVGSLNKPEDPEEEDNSS